MLLNSFGGNLDFIKHIWVLSFINFLYVRNAFKI